MKKERLIKTFALGIIVLFIDMAFSPSVNNGIVKASNYSELVEGTKKSDPWFEFWCNESRVFVRNIGDVNLTNVSVRRYLDGGIIFLNKDKTVVISSIKVGETKEAKLGWIVGLGVSVMTISIACDEGAFVDSDFRILLFFFLFIFIKNE